MKFIVEGELKLAHPRTFKKEIEANSENHAKELVYSLFGSNNGLTRKKIIIKKVAKVE